jgi:hypothetical protein
MVLRNGRERRDENEDAMRRMKQLQIRRTCSGTGRQLQGMRAMGDIATWSDGEASSVLGAISTPSVPS